MWENKPVSDVMALAQAMEPFMETYDIMRSSIRGYNSRGRVDNVNIKGTVRGLIQPSGKRINTNQEGLGRWVTADYEITCVVPEYVSMGDLIFTKNYGVLKVISVEDLRYQGTISAALVRTGTTEQINANDNTKYEPK